MSGELGFLKKDKRSVSCAHVELYPANSYDLSTFYWSNVYLHFDIFFLFLTLVFLLYVFKSKFVTRMSNFGFILLAN